MFRILFSEAISAIASNKSRTFLTLLGIVIGIASVITVIAAGNGGKSIIMKEFQGLSPDTIYLSPNYRDWQNNHSFRIDKINDKDIDDLEKYVPQIKDIAPVISMSTIVKTADNQEKVSITGTNNNYINFVEYKLDYGRIFSRNEVKYQAKVAIIGSLIADKFFPGINPAGKYFTAFGTPFQVIGVLKRKEKSNSISLSDPDKGYNNSIVIPIGVFKRLFGNRGGYSEVLAKVKDISKTNETKKIILSVLAKNHGKWDNKYDKFMIIEMKEQIGMINKVTGSVTIGVALLAGIALLVAAIGIMNIMLVSVKERTREIGIRKALGAKRTHIMLQFLIETILLCGGGGLLGLGISFLASFLIGRFAHWPLIFNPVTAIIAVILSVITGLLSGLYPATRAAKLPPHEALRYE
ncbi:MAG: FtsX-like permease family protein [Spirochaetes bacterium]|nr:FtsX-like permease family protein [Spirochaetota bacterium]